MPKRGRGRPRKVDVGDSEMVSEQNDSDVEEEEESEEVQEKS